MQVNAPNIILAHEQDNGRTEILVLQLNAL